MRIPKPALPGIAALLCIGLSFGVRAQNLGTHMAAAEPPATAASPTTAIVNPKVQPRSETAPVIDAAPKVDPNDNNSIAATVNDESISDYEVRQRAALFVATSGVQATAEDIKKIRGQLLEQLENEKLQLQEAVKKHITVSPTEVDKQINRLISENHITIDQLREVLAHAGVAESALRSQITAQIAWQKAVQDEYQDRVNITPTQIEAEMARYAEGANKPHYLVGEIFLSVDNPEQDAKVLKDAQNIQGQLQAGAPFAVMAHQFSQSPTAAAGGEIGWVHEGQLAPELNQVLTKMATNSISDPIRSVGGYYILALHARQEPIGTKIEAAPTGPTGPEGTLPLARLLLPLGPTPSKEFAEGAMKAAAQIRASFSGCDKLAKVPSQMKGAVYMALGDMKLADLSPEIQKVLAATHPGEAAAPFQSEAGIELMARCDKRVEVRTAFTMPTRQQIEEELFDQQISALARRYMRDIKRNADVETR